MGTELNKEAIVETKTFTICIDDNGYYTEGITENLVEVSEIPYVKNVMYLKAYKYKDGVLILDEDKQNEIIANSLVESKAAKINEINSICQETIYHGTDITLSDGSTKHFSMTQNDQINILGLTTMIAQGCEQIPYHADGEECSYYSVQDIQTIIDTTHSHKTYHLTYCNLLHAVVYECTTKQELDMITYGMELPQAKNAILHQILDI